MRKFHPLLVTVLGILLLLLFGQAQRRPYSTASAQETKPDARDANGQTLLMRAAHERMPTRKIAALLAQGANPNLKDRQGDTALIHLVWWTQYDMVFGGQEENDAQAVKMLVDGGADVNARGSGGLTALMRAAGWRHAPALKALLACGAKTDIRDDLGRTALTWAARDGKKSEAVQALLQAGAPVGPVEALLWDDLPRAREKIAAGELSAHGPFGETLLMVAAEKGQSDIVQILLDRGAEVNARDEQKATALLLAIAGRPIHWIPSGHKTWSVTSATAERTQIVKALLAHHADPNLQNAEHDTALSIAREIQADSIIAPAYPARCKTIIPF